MKDYDGPVYQKHQSASERRFIRQHPNHREVQPFKTALEVRQEQERGYRPVYHHEQPWRAVPRAVASEEVPSEVSMSGEENYTVPFLHYHERNTFNAEAVAQRMSLPEESEEEISIQHDGELRLPRRPKRERFVENTDVQQPWVPVRKLNQTKNEENLRENEVQANVHVEDMQNLQQVAEQAETHRFQPTKLPKPYDPEVGYTPLRHDQQYDQQQEMKRSNKAKDDYLLFDM